MDTLNLATLIARLTDDEGFRARVYDDATGRELTPGSVVRGTPTIGYGTTVVTRDQARWLVESRVAIVLRALHEQLSWFDRLPGVAQEVLVEMGYQMGTGDGNPAGPDGVMDFTRTLEALRTGRWRDAAAGMRESLWYRQTPRRAERAARRIEALIHGPATPPQPTAPPAHDEAKAAATPADPAPRSGPGSASESPPRSPRQDEATPVPDPQRWDWWQT